MQTGNYYRLTQGEYLILAAYIGDDPILSGLLSDFELIGDYYYAFCDDVNDDEEAAIRDAGLILDLWIYIRSGQWIQG